VCMVCLEGVKGLLGEGDGGRTLELCFGGSTMLSCLPFLVYLC
jgi:hypothetical protein